MDVAARVVVRAAATAVGLGLLGHATYTDLNRGCVRNWAVAAGAAAGLSCHALLAGARGFRAAAEGIAAGALWWAAVPACGLGAGDAKLAMAIGSLWGPRAALAGPLAGFVACALWVAPWAVRMRRSGREWRGVPLPMVPWIALGTLLVCAAAVAAPDRSASSP